MPKAVILMYHNIGVPPKGTSIPNLFVTPRMFRFQMGYLKTAGFRVMTIEDLLAAVESGQSRHNMAALTFDDGFMDFYTNALPVLKQYRYPATVYIVSGLVGGHDIWDAQKDPVRKPLMDWAMIDDVFRDGVQIGSHTKSHPRLTTLSAAALREEVQGSKLELEERLGRTIDHFCYPYGDCNEAVEAAVRNAGYRYAVVTKRGHVVCGSNQFALRRIPVKHITNPFSFLYKLHTDSEKRKGRQLSTIL